jgi:outer membrane protein OmpA-like peptidoglycan-associated protein
MKKGILPVAVGIFGCIYGASAQIITAEERVVVTNERRINSDELEYSPVFYKEGIVFISTRHESLIYEVKDKNAEGRNIMSIYRAERDDEGFLQNPVPLADELISRLHEGPVSFDRTAERIFFTRNENLEIAPDGLKKLQIYAARKDSLQWADIQKLPFNNPQFNFCHPSYTADGDALFIASDVPGGYGGMDLYVVYYNGTNWTNMINLGDKVNTPGNEVFPFIAADGTLYFSSDGHSGLGNLDLFYSTQNRRSEEWREPVNLGSPFNSPADDIGFIVDRDNKNGYFSSDRKGGFGGDDIYSFYIEGDIFSPLAGGEKRNLDGLVVTDEDGNPMEGATVSAINFDDVSLAAGDESVVKLTPGDGKDRFMLDVNSDGMGDIELTDKDGKIDIPLTEGSYVLKITKDGFLPEYIVVSPETDLNNLNVKMRRAVDCVALSGKVIRRDGGAPVSGAAVQIVDVETKESITVYSDNFGQYQYCIKCNHTYTVYADYRGTASAPGIADAKGTPCTPGASIDLPLYIGGTPFYAGMSIILPNVYFNFDDAKLRPDAYRDLNEVAGALMNFPEMKLELASHTDARGGKAYNQALSERRTKSVLKYLVSKGVDSDRLVGIGYGESQIRNHCKDGVICSEADHQYNRRTEITILEMGQPGQAAAPIAGINNGQDEAEFADLATAGEADADKGGNDRGDGMATGVSLEAPVFATMDEKSMEGAFAVVAGTFAKYDYATRRATVLSGLGYQDVAIVKQDRNQLYAVWVKTYGDKQSAFTLVKDLAKQQLHAYVLKR